MNSIKFGDENSGSQVGINNGVINFLEERPESRPEPLSTVPFPHDPDFVSRDALFDQIDNKTSIGGSKIVLVGLGGVGKTQLAAEYCHRVRQKSPGTWVFWIHASNAARCEKSLRDLADRTKIPGRQDRTANIFQLVGNWLRDERIGKWILVLDNVDDDGLLRKPSATDQEGQANGQSNASTQPLLRYLLESSNGSIIVTSRNKGVALEISGYKNLIEVQPMEKAEALDLLKNKLNMPAEREDMVQLVEALEFMPLAIIQAAGYITHRSPRCSVSQYLSKIRKSDREAVRLLNYEAGLLHRDWEAKNSILFTWQISFDHIHRVRPSAAGLLSLMSFFDRQGITERLLRVQQSQETNSNLCPGKDKDNTSEKDADSASDYDTNERFEDDVATLSDYSLISVRGHSTVLTMHRLVQLTVRTWLKTHGQLEQWKGKFIHNLCCEFPDGEYESWEMCRSLFPHVKSAASQRPETQHSLQEWATLLYRGAWYAWKSGNIAASRQMALESREQRLKFFGADGEETVNSTALLARSYRLDGRYDEAEQLQVQVLEASKTKLGEDHPDTLLIMANLASTYRSQGQLDKAERLQVQVMEASKTTLGEDHPDTLTTIANLAATFSGQGRWEEAEELDIQVVDTRKAKFGEDHPDTLASMANLAFTWKYMGRHTDAIDLLRSCILKQHQIISPAHPHVAYNSNALLEWEIGAPYIDS
ncbi:unnamed protein product [Penicillium salamii]|uniref:DUF7779 domain-containing protein n=1 Tax=Penicillium salamii TaxID=1612424 RepID=A0A9W4NX49_9EURO|nr:unnamed protein product [Penicillium salamii]CAG8383572.1 unnamed protein product [Penicillium salamii]CAG8402754.1 unnamed protein product [Penicillium salamii]CAG8430523.1 unnamed protein product [Penicillium salamii]CAG8537380.1 unnamed protein product [Penicillium salamii]